MSMNLSQQIKISGHLIQPRRIFGRFNGPKVLLASVPKAGTNLLLKILEAFPNLRFGRDVVGSPEEKRQQLNQIATTKRGQIVVTHLRYTSELPPILRRNRIKGLFISRDPRAVCISHFHHIMRHADHWCHSYFQQELSSADSRIMAVINGLDVEYGDNKRLILPSIDKFFRHRLPYRQDAQFLPLTFEELIGGQGGGSNKQQRDTIIKIATYLNVNLDPNDLENIVNHAFSPASPTFRKGKIDSWRQEMQPKHIAAFKKVAGKLLVELGYENDLNW